mmetsp:Transcript_73567/g.143943  ORF Transcript_73567/g.143943 Transcript_73567/m.143943 type:complete len:357 (+) Transcript_73567:38-1108(+)
MTSLTGKTKATLPGTINPPPYLAALGGGVLQLGALFYVWSQHSPAKACLRDIQSCLTGKSSDPWGRLVIIAEILAFCCWVLSLRGHLHKDPLERFADPSIVDRLWSVLPWCYCWYFVICGEVGALGGRSSNGRVILMAVCSSVWGFRLTYNFFIKGGFSGGEDYRWKEVRSWYPGLKFEVFALVFVHFFQLTEILAFTVPIVPAYYSNQPLNVLDVLAATLYLLLVFGEATADAQMFAYQKEKYRRRAANEDPGPYAQGFIDSGLWAYSRHPNYFCEVTCWWVFYLFSVSALGGGSHWFNWTIGGPVFLTLLFLPPGASLDVTEGLSSRKYPAYPDYQKRVSRFVPWFPTSKSKSA